MTNHKFGCISAPKRGLGEAFGAIWELLLEVVGTWGPQEQKVRKSSSLRIELKIGPKAIKSYFVHISFRIDFGCDFNDLTLIFRVIWGSVLLFQHFARSFMIYRDFFSRHFFDYVLFIFDVPGTCKCVVSVANTMMFRNVASA